MVRVLGIKSQRTSASTLLVCPPCERKASYLESFTLAMPCLQPCGALAVLLLLSQHGQAIPTLIVPVCTTVAEWQTVLLALAVNSYRS